MSSKLLKIYKELKKKDTTKIYLFKNGIFYYMLNEDANIVSKKIGLKITNLSPEIIKCGFPTSKISLKGFIHFNKYIELFRSRNLKYEIIENVSSEKNQTNSSEQILKQIKDLDLSQTTPIEAFNLLYKLQKKINMIEG